MNRQLTGRHVLIWFVAFFGVIFATNAYFITVAVQSFRGEDEAKPYLQGIEYNDTLMRRARQRMLGWNASISAARLRSGVVEVSVGLHDAHGAPESVTRMSGLL